MKKKRQQTQTLHMQNVSGKLMKKTALILIMTLGLLSCSPNKTDVIDINKTEKLITLLDQIKFSEIHIAGRQLIVDETLVKLDSTDTSSVNGYTSDTVELSEWCVKKLYLQDSIVKIHNLIIDSRNHHIIKDNGVYFFVEDGWIDSNWGKAYSLTDITNKADSFKFDRVKSIDKIKTRNNWYNYYAD